MPGPLNGMRAIAPAVTFWFVTIMSFVSVIAMYEPSGDQSGCVARVAIGRRPLFGPIGLPVAASRSVSVPLSAVTIIEPSGENVAQPIGRAGVVRIGVMSA